MDLWTSPTDRREPCGPCGQPVDNADALPTACPHSGASRPQAPQDQPPVILRGQHRTTLRRGCLHRPFKTTSASHSNRSQHRPRPGSPPSLQAHFRMGLDCTLTGGADDDWLHGGSGNDTFVFEGRRRATPWCRPSCLVPLRRAPMRPRPESFANCRVVRRVSCRKSHVIAVSRLSRNASEPRRSRTFEHCADRPESYALRPSRDSSRASRRAGGLSVERERRHAGGFRRQIDRRWPS